MTFPKLKLGLFFVSSCLLAVVFAGNGCKTSGDEGDTCNPLVLQDECHSGLHCTQTTCTYAYCCPTSGSSTNLNCHFGGCPSDDAGDDASEDAGDDAATPTGTDAGDAAPENG